MPPRIWIGSCWNNSARARIWARSRPIRSSPSAAACGRSKIASSNATRPKPRSACSSRSWPNWPTLIEQCKKQCAGGQCNNSSNAPPKPGGKPGSGKKGGTGNATASQQPAKESTDTLRKPGGDRAELEAMQQLNKEIWGHLPPKLREQLQSGSVEQFLPKYEQLIEAYYKRLAEERRE